jgi:hypothetical protein
LLTAPLTTKLYEAAVVVAPSETTLGPVLLASEAPPVRRLRLSWLHFAKERFARTVPVGREIAKD